jgi:hypothetical protein
MEESKFAKTYVFNHMVLDKKEMAAGDIISQNHDKT